MPAQPQLSDFPYVFTQVVAWGDMDALSHVNNVQYYKYAESARLSYLTELHQRYQTGLKFMVASNSCKYLAPVVFPDTLNIGVRIKDIRTSGFLMEYLIFSKQQNQTVAIMEAIVVAVDGEPLAKVPLIKDFEQKVDHFNHSVQQSMD